MADHNPITPAIATCAALVKRSPRNVIAAEIAMHQLLTILFKEIAVLIASGLPGSSKWVAAEDRPGYLSRSVDSVTLYVPWHLVAAIPTGTDLQEYVNLSSGIRGSAPSTICLSGSATGSGALPEVADLDFCEYFDTKRSGGWTVVCRRAGLAQDNLVCLQIKEHGTASNTPSRSLAGMSEPGAVSDFIDDVNQRNITALKCEFVAHLNNGDVTEATSVVIGIPDDDLSAATHLSFVAQEALLGTPGSWAPHDLAAPRQLGTYVIWLSRESKSLIGADVCKSAKRLLSLTRLMCLEEASSRVLTCLVSGHLAIRSVLMARLGLLQKLSTNDIAETRRFVQPLTQIIERLRTRLRGQVGSIGHSTLEDERPGTSTTADEVSRSEITGIYAEYVAPLL